MNAFLPFVVGLVAWTFLEYVIHGWLSHTFDTFATPLHAMHHRDPSAVFTLTAWPFAVLILLLSALIWKFTGPTIFSLGLVGGFAGYELLHYRMHYREPASRFESWLRVHHLIHHMRRPQACYGVTTSFWDRVFRTELSAIEINELTPAIEKIRPLTVPSNFHRLVQNLTQRA